MISCRTLSRQLMLGGECYKVEEIPISCDSNRRKRCNDSLAKGSMDELRSIEGKGSCTSTLGLLRVGNLISIASIGIIHRTKCEATIFESLYNKSDKASCAGQRVDNVSHCITDASQSRQITVGVLPKLVSDFATATCSDLS
jgi:hypothetical protein